MINLKKKIKKIFMRNRPPYFQDTKAWKIILAENEQLKAEIKELQNAMFCKKCLNLTIKNRLSRQDVRKLTEALNECYSTIAAIEKGNAELKLKLKKLQVAVAENTIHRILCPHHMKYE